MSTEIIKNWTGTHFAIIDRDVVPRWGASFGAVNDLNIKNSPWEDGITLFHKASSLSNYPMFAWYIIWWRMPDGRLSFTIEP